MNGKPLRVNGYEIDRKDVKEIEKEIELYPIRKARREFLEAKYPDSGLDVPGYSTYRSPQVDTLPGAPGKVSDPTANRAVDRVTALGETQNLAYLQRWVQAMDELMERLDSVQKAIIEKYVMVPKQKRPTITEVVADCHASQTQCYYWRNEAYMQFAFLLLDEKKIRKIPEKNPKS